MLLKCWEIEGVGLFSVSTSFSKFWECLVAQKIEKSNTKSCMSGLSFGKSRTLDNDIRIFSTMGVTPWTHSFIIK